MKIKELYTDASKWTQHYLARTANGLPVSTGSTNAACFCLIGAVYYCYSSPKDCNDIIAKIYNHIGRGLAAWNDETNRTFEEVKALVEQLNI